MSRAGSGTQRALKSGYTEGETEGEEGLGLVYGGGFSDTEALSVRPPIDPVLSSLPDISFARCFLCRLSHFSCQHCKHAQCLITASRSFLQTLFFLSHFSSFFCSFFLIPSITVGLNEPPSGKRMHFIHSLTHSTLSCPYLFVVNSNSSPCGGCRALEPPFF